MELKELYQLAEDKDISVEHFHLEENKALTAEYISGSFAIALDDKKIENKTEEKMCLAHGKTVHSRIKKHLVFLFGKRVHLDANGAYIFF